MAKVEIITYINAPHELSLRDIQYGWEEAMAHPKAKVKIVDVRMDGAEETLVVMYDESGGVATDAEVIKALEEEFAD